MSFPEFKNSKDITEKTIHLRHPNEPQSDDEFEIERDVLLNILYDTIKNDVEFAFSNSIKTINDTEEFVIVTFKDGTFKNFNFVFGCDGIHSAVRKIHFGEETEHSHFLSQYFSIAILKKLLIEQYCLQL